MIEARARHALVTFDGEEVVIDRHGEITRIPVTRITAVEVEPPTFASLGVVRFTQPGRRTREGVAMFDPEDDACVLVRGRRQLRGLGPLLAAVRDEIAAAEE
jgi:hypothetical protein